MKLVRYNHVWLYAKYHYKRTQPDADGTTFCINDLKIIISHACGLLVEHVGECQVFRVLLDIVLEHRQQHMHTKIILEIFSHDITMYLPRSLFDVCIKHIR